MVGFAAIVTALHLVLYVSTTGSPIDHSTPAWQGWWDQSQYLRSAAAFASGNLEAAEHWYALGYPLLITPFVRLLPKDPFFVVNLVSLVVFALAFLAYFRPIVGAVPSMAAFLVAQLLPARVEAPHAVNFLIWIQYVFPWNTVPVAAMLMVIAVVVRGLRVGDSTRKDAALGLLASAVVAIRPSDAFPLLAVGAFYAQQRLLRERAFAKVATAMAAAGIVLGLYCVLSWTIYGGLATPYHDAVRAIGASGSDLHERAFAILIDATVTHDEPQAALARLQPWLIVAMPLAIAWAAIDVRRGLLIVAPAALSLMSYISFNDFWPYALVRLSLIHYVAWTLPILTAAGCAGAVVMIREKRWVALGAALAGAVILASLRIVATPVPVANLAVADLPNGYTSYEMTFDARQEIDAIDFAGAASGDSRAVTLKAFDVIEDGHALSLFGGYRPIQLQSGLRIGLNRHVEAAQVRVVLDNTISHHPTGMPDVRALRFELTIAPFVSIVNLEGLFENWRLN